MKARAVVSIGAVLGSTMLVGMFNAACSSDNSGGSTSAGGTAPVAGTNTGGSATAGTGGSSAGSGGSATGGGMGLMMINGMCPANSVKRMDGLCYCQPTTLSACMDGCGDFMTDPDRCGGCDTKCTAQQTCNAGKCGKDPTVVVPAAAGCGSMKIAVAGGKLYYTDMMHGTVSSVATTGGTPMAVATGQMGPTLLSVTADKVFWLASTAKQIMSAPIAGGAATPLLKAAEAMDIGGFALTPDGMSVVYSTATFVKKVPAAGGADAVEVGHEDSGIPKALAVTDKFVGYPADINGDVDVMQLMDTPSVCASEDSAVMNKDCKRLGRSQGALNFDTIYIIGDNTYWANQASIYTSSASMPSGFNETIVQANSPTANKITAFAIAKDVVYLADDSGLVYTSPLMKDSMPTQIARGQTSPSSIAVDDTNVYWADGDCSIKSLPLK
ncbi:MAG TPA: hypothetical protein VHB79_20240 [Polyangiaceae bacterium]|nr:hypothetical protein [Polyangiaceae bacterium]